MYTNIAFYKFVNLENTEQLQTEFKDLCSELNLKGTVILAAEGINSCLVGNDEDILKFMRWMRQDDRFSDIEFKTSLSKNIPFRRMIVKLKKETIPMGFEYIKPAQSSGKYVEPLQLKSWLDNNEDILIIDTRNDYEVELGTFRGAINPNLKIFREFPDWIKEKVSENEDWKKKKIVTFCTGGIRCEKATAYMQHIGFENVYQIHGGILKYFEDTHKHAPNDDNYFDGECFVFDYRVAIEKNLAPTKQYTVCFNCWNPLKVDDLTRPEYVPKISCHHCIKK